MNRNVTYYIEIVPISRDNLYIKPSLLRDIHSFIFDEQFEILDVTLCLYNVQIFTKFYVIMCLTYIQKQWQDVLIHIGSRVPARLLGYFSLKSWLLF